MYNSFDPRYGVYVSRYKFRGDFAAEADSIEMHNPDPHPYYSQLCECRGQNENFKLAMFKSSDGGVATQNAVPDKPLVADDFAYTELYYKHSALRNIIDWFQCEKTRVRLYQQLPGVTLKTHTDHDNERNQFDPNNISLRAIVQISGEDNYYRFVSRDSDVTIRLEPGQFCLVNHDTVAHGTVNNGNIPRNTLNIACVWNDWMADMTKIGNCDIEYIDV